MNRIDRFYANMLKTILNDGFKYEDPNRKSVTRKQIPHFSIELTNCDTPVISLRKSYFKGAVGELLLFLQGHTDIRKFHEYGVNFWDKDVLNRASRFKFSQDDDEYYSIGKSYPHQYFKQHSVFDNFKQNRFRTDLIIDSWQVDDLDDMALKPCHFNYQLIADKDGFIINYTSRSTDSLLGFPVNIQFYFLMGLILEKWSGNKFGGVKADLRNVHLYDNQIILAEKIINLHDDITDGSVNDIIFSIPYINIDTSDWKIDLPFSDFIKTVKPEHFKLKSYISFIDEKVPMLVYSN